MRGFIAFESVGETLLSVTIQMKAINQHFTMELLNMLCWEFIAFESVGETLLSETIQMKAINQHFTMELLNMLCGGL